MSNRLYKLITEADDVFTAPSEEELVARYAATQHGWKKNTDGSYDVIGYAALKHSLAKKGKMLVRFNKVTGDFFCDHMGLTSLEGAPQEVWGNFYCNENKLTTLEGAPKKVGGAFRCHGNSVLFTVNDVKAVSNVKGIIHVI